MGEVGKRGAFSNSLSGPGADNSCPEPAPKRRRASKRKQYCPSRDNGARVRGPRGGRGFLVTCPLDRERHAGRDALICLDEVCERWLTDAGLPLDDPTSAKAKPDKLSVVESVSAELEALREQNWGGTLSSGPENRLSLMKTGVRGILFLRLNDARVDATAVAKMLLDGCVQKRRPLGRSIIRLYAVESLSYASVECISAAVGALGKDRFEAAAVNIKTYGIILERRMANLDREVVLRKIASNVPLVAKVDLNNPDCSLVLQVFKSTCAICVMPGFRRYRKYNVIKLAERGYCMTEEKNAKDGDAHPRAREDICISAPL